MENLGSIINVVVLSNQDYNIYYRAEYIHIYGAGGRLLTALINKTVRAM